MVVVVTRAAVVDAVATGSIETNAVYQLPVQRSVPRASRMPGELRGGVAVVVLGDAALLGLVGERRELDDVLHVFGIDAAGGGQRIADGGNRARR